MTGTLWRICSGFYAVSHTKSWLHVKMGQEKMPARFGMKAVNPHPKLSCWPETSVLAIVRCALSSLPLPPPLFPQSYYTNALDDDGSQPWACQNAWIIRSRSSTAAAHLARVLGHFLVAVFWGIKREFTGNVLKHAGARKRPVHIPHSSHTRGPKTSSFTPLAHAFALTTKSRAAYCYLQSFFGNHIIIIIMHSPFFGAVCTVKFIKNMSVQCRPGFCSWYI